MIYKRKVWALYTRDEGGESVTLHATQREALEEVASVYDIETEGMTDEQIDRACQAHGVWGFLKEVEVPEA